MQEQYCLYYTARLEKSRCWLVSSALRGTEHIAFDRAFNVSESIFEFFVPRAMEPVFLEVMAYFEAKKIVSELTKKPNRLNPDLSLEVSSLS